MSVSPKITMVGAGGMSFGPTMVNDVVHTKRLRGARLVLHDVDAERLERAYQFGCKLNAAAGAPVVLDYSTDPAEALDGADFVLQQRRVRSLPLLAPGLRGPQPATALARSPARTGGPARCSTRCAASRTR